MDFKKTKWIEEKRKDWPEGSLERQLKLNYPGCSSAFEASQKVRNLPKNETAAQATKPNQDDEMKRILKDVEIITKDFDIEKLDHKVRTQLANMPLSTLEEANLWKEACVKAMGEQKVSKTLIANVCRGELWD